MAKNVKKIAVKSKVEVAKKATYPKITKKEKMNALSTEINQNNVKAFTFPTAASIAERKLSQKEGNKPAKLPKTPQPKFFLRNDRVEHPAHGVGVVVAVKENSCYDVFFKRDDDAIGAADGAVADPRECVGEELKLIDRDKNATKKATRTKVFTKADFTKFENLPLLCAFKTEESAAPGTPTYVKVGNTSAVRAILEFLTDGDLSVPTMFLNQFGNETAPTEKIRLKKSDKVMPLQFHDR